MAKENTIYFHTGMLALWIRGLGETVSCFYIFIAAAEDMYLCYKSYWLSCSNSKQQTRSLGETVACSAQSRRHRHFSCLLFCSCAMHCCLRVFLAQQPLQGGCCCFVLASWGQHFVSLFAAPGKLETLKIEPKCFKGVQKRWSQLFTKKSFWATNVPKMNPLGTPKTL